MSEKSKNEVAAAECRKAEVAEAERQSAYVKPHYTTRKVEDDAWEVGVVVPGVKRGDVRVSLDDKDLEVVAHRHHDLPEGWRPLNDRGPSPDYRLNLELAVDVDEERISAKLENGILTLRLPVAEAARPKTISVE